jgi:transmembrane sensor
MEPLNDFTRAGRLLAEHQDASMDQAADLALLRQKFVEAGRGRRAGSRSILLFAAGLALVAGALLLTVGLAQRGKPLTFSVGDGDRVGEVDGWLAAPVGRPLPVRFSDGTFVTLQPTARARVTKIAQAGAMLVVETGRAEFAVVKRKSAAWHVSLGPFRVQVTGTRFVADWDPREERLLLTMQEGTVIVSGCMFGAGRPFVAGDTVRASCRDRHADVSTNAPSPTAKAVVDTTPSSQPPGQIREEPGSNDEHGSSAAFGSARANPTPTAARPSSSWRDLMRQGRHGEALDAAEALGFSSECATASAADLVALGDAARYQGRLDRAEEAYHAVRRRFPGHERAAVAAFALGRVAFDQRGSFSNAARWFRAYLDEQPNGRLARDALGRLMEAHSRAGDLASARKEARRYLEHYPTGPHVEMARRLHAD